MGAWNHGRFPPWQLCSRLWDHLDCSMADGPSEVESGLWKGWTSLLLLSGKPAAGTRLAPLQSAEMFAGSGGMSSAPGPYVQG